MSRAIGASRLLAGAGRVASGAGGALYLIALLLSLLICGGVGRSLIGGSLGFVIGIVVGPAVFWWLPIYVAIVSGFDAFLRAALMCWLPWLLAYLVGLLGSFLTDAAERVAERANAHAHVTASADPRA